MYIYKKTLLAIPFFLGHCCTEDTKQQQKQCKLTSSIVHEENLMAQKKYKIQGNNLQHF